MMKKGVLEGKYQLVFFTPECLIRKERWRDALKSDIFQSRMRVVGVDEAHVVKK